MSNKHPHDAVIRAWLDGKTVQRQHHLSGKWLDIPAHNICWVAFFNPEDSYRIKPTVAKYRRYIYKSEDGYVVAMPAFVDDVSNIEKWPGFIRWIDTEWQEVEV